MDNLITKEMIVLDLEVDNKNDAIKRLAKIMESQDKLTDYEGFISQVNKREETFPTSLGFDFAIPHGKCNAVKNAAIAFARLKKEVQWSKDEKAKYIFLIAVSEQEVGDKHLKILAQLSRKIMRDEFREKIQNANSICEIINILNS